MGFWFFMLIMVLLLPLIMIGFGKRFSSKPPEQIRWGVILLFLTVTGMLAVWNRSSDTVGIAGGIICMLQCIPLIASIVSTEHALRETFDKHGIRWKFPDT